MRGLHLNVGMLRDQRGIALPMSLLALLILSTLVISFALLATTEPLIATNQKMVAQARAVAESGLEQAIWALNNATPPVPANMPSPYDGLTDIVISNSSGTQIGVARVTVTQPGPTNERSVVSVGWIPTYQGKAHQKIQATVSRFLFIGSPPPASLTVRGEINVSGNSDIDSRADGSCGNKDGTWSEGATSYGGSATIYGRDGNNTANQSSGTPTDRKQNVADSAFAPFTLSNTASGDLDTLKALAKANGTYYSGPSVQGLDFNASNQLKNGIIFIDTVSGQNIDANVPPGTNCLLGGGQCTPTSDFASVSIHGNSEADPSGIFSGMIIVNGSLAISGDFHMHGLVYVVNDLSYTGTGNGEIDGAVITQNIRDTSSTSIDTNAGGNATIKYNCAYARNPAGSLPQGFTVKPGTYKEVSGS